MMYELAVSGIPLSFFSVLINNLHLLLNAVDADKSVFAMLILIRLLQLLWSFDWLPGRTLLALTGESIEPIGVSAACAHTPNSWFD
jgi:hypothetical protein